MAARSFSISIDKSQDEMQEILQHIKRVHGRALDAGLKRCARVAAREVKSAYQHGRKAGLPTIAKLTRAKRRLGKLKGTWPAVPPFGGGTKPLWRSGQLARAVDWEKVNTYNYIVGVAGGVPVAFNNPSGARTLDQLAVMHETGWTRTFPVTKRMRAYLMILFGRSTGVKGAGGRMQTDEGDEPTGDTISTVIKARPLWQMVFDAYAETLFFNEFVQSFERVLFKTLGSGVTVT